MKKNSVLIILFTFLFQLVIAQNKYTLSGYVRDSISGESLIAASVFVKSNSQGAYTNEYGFYSLSLVMGTYEIVYSYVGFKTITKTIVLDVDTRMNINLPSSANTLKEIVVEIEKKDGNVQNSEVGKYELQVEKIKTLPAIFGEVDIMKIIQLLPGVQGGTEGTSGFYVRGGGPDQNLVLLDEAVVYNTGHLFGFFSVFNADAILNTTLYKGGMPAEYGGRISSVLDINMKEGNSKTFHASGGIGLIASRLTLEGPIVKKQIFIYVIGSKNLY